MGVERMVSSEELQVWRKLLGIKMESFTACGVDYTLFFGEKGWECDCMDFKVRGGSHKYEFKEKGKRHTIQACKHIGQHIANQGIEVYEIYPWSTTKKKILPQEKP